MRTQLIPREEKKVKKVRFKIEEVPFPVGARVCIKHPRTGRISRNRSVVKTVGTKSVILDNGQKWHVSKIAKDRSEPRQINDYYELPDWRRTIRREDNSRLDGTVTEDNYGATSISDDSDESDGREKRNRKSKRDPDFVYF